MEKRLDYITTLIIHMQSYDVELRHKAIETLGTIKAREAFIPLTCFLFDENYKTRKLAIAALDQILEKKDIESLRKDINQEDKEIHAQGLYGLRMAEIRPEETTVIMEKVWEVFTSLDESISRIAALILGKLIPPDWQVKLVPLLDPAIPHHVRIGAIYIIGEKKNQKMVPCLLDLLRGVSRDEIRHGFKDDKQRELVTELLYALGKVDIEAAAPEAYKIYNYVQSDSFMSSYVEKSIENPGKFNMKWLMEKGRYQYPLVFIEDLVANSRDIYIYRGVMEMLASGLQDDINGALKFLDLRLRDDDPNNAQFSITHYMRLARIDSTMIQKAEINLLKCLKLPSENPDYSRIILKCAIKAAVLFNSAEVRNQLIRLLEYDFTQEGEAMSLSTFSSLAVHDKLDKIPSPYSLIFWALARMDNVDVEKAAVQHLGNHNLAVREQAIRYLRTLSLDKKYLPQIAPLLGDTDKDIRKEAVAAFSKTPSKATWDIISSKIQSKNVEERANLVEIADNILSSLSETDKEQVLSEVIPMLEDSSSTISEKVVALLSENGSEKIGDKVSPYLKNPSPELQDRAYRILGTIENKIRESKWIRPTHIADIAREANHIW